LNADLKPVDERTITRNLEKVLHNRRELFMDTPENALAPTGSVVFMRSEMQVVTQFGFFLPSKSFRKEHSRLKR
jgi:hypothetical protein